MKKYEKKYESVLDKLFNNLNLNHIADSDNYYVSKCDEHTITQVASARIFLWLERFCGKDGRVRAFNQIMHKYLPITNYNVEVGDVNYFDLYNSNSTFILKDTLINDNKGSFFSMHYHSPYKQKFNHKNIHTPIEITKYGSDDVVLERTKYLNDMRLAA